MGLPVQKCRRPRPDLGPVHRHHFWMASRPPVDHRREFLHRMAAGLRRDDVVGPEGGTFVRTDHLRVHGRPGPVEPARLRPVLPHHHLGGVHCAHRLVLERVPGDVRRDGRHPLRRTALRPAPVPGQDERLRGHRNRTRVGRAQHLLGRGVSDRPAIWDMEHSHLGVRRRRHLVRSRSPSDADVRAADELPGVLSGVRGHPLDSVRSAHDSVLGRQLPGADVAESARPD